MAPTQEALYEDIDLELSWSERDLPERERTTHVQALESGLEATGVDIAAFNCLLMNVKTHAYNEFVLEHELREVYARIPTLTLQRGVTRPAYLRRWFAPQSARELLAFRELVEEYEHADVLRVVLARAARSA